MTHDLLSLRPYQRQAIDAVWAAHLDGMKRPAVVLPTGAGKTVIFSHMVKEHQEANPGKRALVLVHRDELADQALAKLASVAPHLSLGKVKAEHDQTGAAVMVASVQTVSRQGRLARLIESQESRGRIGLVITDECHHAAAESYRRIYSAFPKADHVGVTATLARGDGVGLGSVWEDVVYQRSILRMIADGYLVDVRSQVVSTELDLGSVKRSGGDYQVGALGQAMQEAGVPEQVAKAVAEYASDRRSIVFTPTVATAYATVDALEALGIRAAAIDGTTPREERQYRYRQFADGTIRALVNCMVLTEGFDMPQADCVVVARPTTSQPLYCLDSATEVLTDQGWKGMGDDLSGCRPAAYSLEDGSIRWSDLLGRVERPLEVGETMYALSSPTADIRVSDQHRMVWQGRRGTEWRVSTAQDLASRLSEYRIPIAGVQKAPGVPLTDDELRFVGWFMTDGTLNRKTNAISISQAEHQPWNADIKAMLEGCGFKYAVHRHQGGTKFRATSDRLKYTVSKGKPRGAGKHLRGWGDLEPYLSKDLSLALEDMTREQLAVLLHALHLGDGAKQARTNGWVRRSYHISTGNRVFADRLQSLCVRRGFKCNVALHSYNENPLYVLHIKDVSVKSVRGGAQTDGASLGPVQFTPGETVWCVETDAGTIVTRRNGKAAVLGNCQMVGRGLRTYPGKTDCLVLNVAGASGRISTLVDLAEGEPMPRSGLKDRESLAEAAIRAEEEMEDAERRAQEQEDGFTLGFRLQRRDSDLFAGSDQTWLRTHGGVPFVPAGQDGVIALWPSRETGADGQPLWDVAFVPKNRTTGGPWKRLHEALPMGTAMAWAETEADDYASFGVRRGASWRKKKASAAQVGLAQRMHLPVHENMRAGEVGDLLSIAFASRTIDPFAQHVAQHTAVSASV